MLGGRGPGQALHALYLPCPQAFDLGLDIQHTNLTYMLTKKAGLPFLKDFFFI
jgi:hypothetical protein